MNTYSEEEQIESLKSWWKDNGRSVVAGVMLGVIVVVGWNLWNNYHQQQAVESSDLYQQLLERMNQKQFDSAQKLAERIVQLYGSTIYADFARLAIAKMSVEAHDLLTARVTLSELIKNTGNDNMRHLARIRLLRVMLANGELEPALQMIKGIDHDSFGKFEGQYLEIEGDILLALKRPSEARHAYLEAKDHGYESRFLQMKLDDLAPPQVVEFND